MQADYIIHVVGPMCHGPRATESQKDQLKTAVRAALNKAKELGCSCLALPAISTGIFGFKPKAKGCEAIVDACIEFCERKRFGNITEIRLVNIDEETTHEMENALRSREGARNSSAPALAPSHPTPKATSELTKDHLNKYAAAGVLFVGSSKNGTIEVLLPIEYRLGEGDRLNILGGKKDDSDRGPAHTAARELHEETAGLLGKRLCRQLVLASTPLWIGPGRYILYVCPVASLTKQISKKLQDLPMQYASLRFKPPGAEPESLVWVDWTKLLESARNGGRARVLSVSVWHRKHLFAVGGCVKRENKIRISIFLEKTLPSKLVQVAVEDALEQKVDIRVEAEVEQKVDEPKQITPQEFLQDMRGKVATVKDLLCKAHSNRADFVESLLGSQWLLQLKAPPIPPASLNPIEVLSKTSSEYRKVADHFPKERSSQIYCIRRSNVTNQHQRYRTACATERQQDQLSSQEIQPLFHGTPETWRATAIAMNGFDLRIRLVGRALGDGVYSSLQVQTALGYCGAKGSIIVMRGLQTKKTIQSNQVRVFPDARLLDVQYLVDFAATPDIRNEAADAAQKAAEKKAEELKKLKSKAKNDEEDYKKKSVEWFQSCAKTFVNRVEGWIQQVNQWNSDDEKLQQLHARFCQEVKQFDGRLPIYSKKEDLVKSISSHLVTIVLAETGSGKSTQIPQYVLHEVLKDGSDQRAIAVLQPKRVNAIELSKRVASELGEFGNELVGFRLGFGHTNVGRNTRIEFMTHGLFVELAADPKRFLERYSCVILDEAHERSVHVDFSFGLLRRLVAYARKGIKSKTDTPSTLPLHVVVMSATIQDEAETFRQFLDEEGDSSTVVKVAGRTFPVQVIHSGLELDENDVGAAGVGKVLSSVAVQAAIDLLDTTSEGNILVFMPGSSNINRAVDSVYGLLSSPKSFEADRESGAFFLCNVAAGQGKTKTCSLAVHRFYGTLSDEERGAVMKNSSEMRTLIFSTDVAETGLTIPNVRYVVDTGVQRSVGWDEASGAPIMITGPITKSSMEQRAGRAGRTASGMCIRLFTEQSAREFQPSSNQLEGDLTRAALRILSFEETIANQDDLKSIKLLRPMSEEKKQGAHAVLASLGAIENNGDGIRLTQAGKSMMQLSMNLLLGRLIFFAARVGCIHQGILLCSLLMTSNPERLLPPQSPPSQKTARKPAMAEFGDESGDHWTLLNIFEAFLAQKDKSKPFQVVSWCKQKQLDVTTLEEADRIRGHVMKKVLSVTGKLTNDEHLLEKHGGKKRALLLAVTAAYTDHLATLKRPGDAQHGMIRVRPAQARLVGEEAEEKKEAAESNGSNSDARQSVRLDRRSWLRHMEVKPENNLVVFSSVMGSDYGGEKQIPSVQLVSFVTAKDVEDASPGWCKEVNFGVILGSVVQHNRTTKLTKEQSKAFKRKKNPIRDAIRRIPGANVFLDQDNLVVFAPENAMPLVDLYLKQLLVQNEEVVLKFPVSPDEIDKFRGQFLGKGGKNIKSLRRSLNNFAIESGAEGPEPVKVTVKTDRCTVQVDSSAVSVISAIIGRVHSATLNCIDESLRIQGLLQLQGSSAKSALGAGGHNHGNPRLLKLTTSTLPSLSFASRDDAVLAFCHQMLWKDQKVEIYGGFVRDFIINNKPTNDTDVLVNDNQHLKEVKKLLFKFMQRIGVTCQNRDGVTRGSANTTTFTTSNGSTFDIDLVDRNRVQRVKQPPFVDATPSNMCLRFKNGAVDFGLKVPTTAVLKQPMPALTTCIQHTHNRTFEFFYDPDSDVGKQRLDKYLKKKAAEGWKQLPTSQKWWQL